MSIINVPYKFIKYFTSSFLFANEMKFEHERAKRLTNPQAKTKHLLIAFSGYTHNVIKSTPGYF